ncbi:MAG: murein biosynthesis integral membrane protein MurJ [Gammaproteobacteria bacterium]|nr:murein biosynthesis integral membrane protein MurJ [Gammaproteobacteria bacterium]HBW83105.1 murein biosynthesis integral membrane protein MurJ [Gammaproteobacteria bacterium]
MNNGKPAAEQSESPGQPPREGLLRSSGVTGSMTLVSRVLGLARDVVIARLFGTSDATDAFFLANKIPNFMRRLFAEGAFSQAFVPILSEYRSQKPLEAVQNLIGATTASLGGFLLAITLLVVIAAPYLAVPIAYGFTDEPEKFALFVQMLRITFPYLLLISLTALCSAILNSYGRFAVPALTPAFLNISLISSSFLLAPYLRKPELALAWAVLIAGFAQLLFQLPFLARLRLLPIPRLNSEREGLSRIKQLMLPALFGVSVSQINLLLDTVIASLLVTGSVSWLYYSDRLVELPLGTFGIAIAIVVLPSLSRQHAESSLEAFSATLDWALRLVVLIALPATIGLMVLAEPLLITLFQNQNFPVEDIVNSAGSLRAYAIGLLAFMGVKIFAPGFYARQDTATPVRIGIIAMLANMVLNLLFYLSGLAHVGLALATSLAAYVNAGGLLLMLKRDDVFRLRPGWPRFLLQVSLANVVMMAFVLIGLDSWLVWQDWSVLEQASRLAFLVLAGIFTYFAVLFATGMRWSQFKR